MAWIESHEEIGDHHKTLRLSQLLNCSIPEAVGYLHLLWHYTLKVAWKDGDLSKFTPNIIARSCWWEGEPEAFVKALRGAGWMDYYRVHEWQEYAKHIIYQRLYNETRRKDLTAVKSLQNSGNTVKIHQLPNLTVPNLTKPNKEDGFLVPEDLRENEPEIKDWLEYKKQRRESYKSEKGFAALMEKFRKIPKDNRRASVDWSMANNWAGLFEKKIEIAERKQRNVVPSSQRTQEIIKEFNP